MTLFHCMDMPIIILMHLLLQRDRKLILSDICGYLYCHQSGSLSFLHLRTGSCRINEDRCKLNQCKSSGWDCVESEAVQHFILKCPLYEDNHQQLQNNFFSQLGINKMSMIQRTKNKNLHNSEWQGDLMLY